MRMDGELHHLYWKDHLVGTITDVGWTDFPWAGGKIAIGNLSKEVREVLEYISKESESEDGLLDWPFPDEMADHWRIVKPSGEQVEITPPVVDFSDGHVRWR
jgi:hypothetical protein